MVWVIKSEWHSVEKRYGAEIDEYVLSQIYPDSVSYTHLTLPTILKMLLMMLDGMLI